MKKNKGFTLVEIIVSFALTMVVVLFLFQLIITLKQIYTNNFTASNLTLKQANISKMINNDLLTSNLGNVTGITVSNLGKECYNISFQSGIIRNICSDKINNTIIYNDYEFDLVKGSQVGNLSVEIKDTGDLYIHIPISYPDLDNDYGIKAVYISK